MDRTLTYIRMADCREIQDGHRVALGDCYKDRARDDSVDICADDQWYSAELQAQLIWLPRQDQLQKMASSCFKAGLDLEILYAWYQQNRPHDVADEWDSMEQLWLAFVMKEKHGKVWDGEAWVDAIPA